MPTQLIQNEMGRLLPAERDLHDCWLWQGEIDSDGYGVFDCVYPGGSEKFLAQRSALMVFGNIPVYENEKVINTCRNKLCCNPRHLQVVKVHKSLI